MRASLRTAVPLEATRMLPSSSTCSGRFRRWWRGKIRSTRNSSPRALSSSGQQCRAISSIRGDVQRSARMRGGEDFLMCGSMLEQRDRSSCENRSLHSRYSHATTPYETDTGLHIAGLHTAVTTWRNKNNIVTTNLNVATCCAPSPSLPRRTKVHHEHKIYVALPSLVEHKSAP